MSERLWSSRTEEPAISTIGWVLIAVTAWVVVAVVVGVVVGRAVARRDRQIPRADPADVTVTQVDVPAQRQSVLSRVSLRLGRRG